MFQTPSKKERRTNAGGDSTNNFILFDCLTNETPVPKSIEAVKLPYSTSPDTFCCVVDNVLSHEECKSIVQKAEDVGFSQALLNVGGGRQILATDIRNSDRTMVDDKVFAEILFNRIRHLLPTSRASENAPPNTLKGLNERLRILRYKPGHDFKPHMDGCYVSPDGNEQSFLTVMLYLNEGFEGGSTLFHSMDERASVAVVPKPGKVLVFDHRLYHEGQIIQKGTKYALRTDVMYRIDRE